MAEIISRIAPTPSGFLHMGNACNFVLTWLLVKMQKGRLRLRIDDLDKQRVRPEYLDDIFYTLEWLGLDWEDGPSSVAAHLQEHSQQDRIPLYDQAIQTLVDQEKVFACQCSRKQILAASEDGQYPQTCRHLLLSGEDSHHALRILTPKDEQISWMDQLAGEISISLYQQMRDFVIRRKDGIPAYQIASIVDDLAYGTNLVVRGQDLLESTAAQLFLAKGLKEQDFHLIQWHHHPLLTDAGGKLSKSAGSFAIRTWREQGHPPARVYQQVSRWLGLPELVDHPETLLALGREMN